MAYRPNKREAGFGEEVADERCRAVYVQTPSFLFAIDYVFVSSLCRWKSNLSN